MVQGGYVSASSAKTLTVKKRSNVLDKGTKSTKRNTLHPNNNNNNNNEDDKDDSPPPASKVDVSALILWCQLNWLI